MMLLQITGVARLTRNPEVRFLPGSDTAVAQFGVACSDKYKDKEKTAFYDCKAWGKLAEICGEYLVKGAQIYIIGKLEQEAWEDKDSGQKRSKHVIRIERMQMIGSRKEQGGDDRFSSGNTPSGGGFSEDDIPFAPYMDSLVSP